MGAKVIIQQFTLGDRVTNHPLWDINISDMPTGFTAPIYDGDDITFEQFANSCLRNFGIYLRFEGKYPNLSRYEIPDKIYPSDYYKKRYEEAKAEYEKHLANPKTKEELEVEYLSYVNEVIKENEDRQKENEALKNRYNAMLSKVRKWTPPSKDYEGIKDFMESQLIDSLDFDCSHVYVEDIVPKDEWIQKRINRSDLVKSMKRSLEDYNKAVVAAEKDTQWLKTFSESIKKVIE